MRVVCCSSGCCGIKHIRDFPASPTDTIYPGLHDGHDQDQSSTQPEPYENWEQSQQSGGVKAGEWFKRLVNHIRERRESGLITVNLAAEPDYDSDWYCEDWQASSIDGYDMYRVDMWRPILFGLGFVETEFTNSNSGNKVFHYTLAYD